ncbi:queuosine precursor transporter, partial [Mesorhizobium sp.]
VAAMALVVVASNVLVQFPLQGAIGGLSLADILTWGAFTYPFSFLVTDLANRRYGPAVARRIVFVGFTAAVICSVVIPPLLFRYGLIEF